MDEIIIKKQKKAAVRPVLRSMQVFDKVVFPVQRLSVVRATLQSVEVEYGFEYRTRVDKPSGKIEIIRIK